MEENKNLKLEIEVLKKRVTALENKESGLFTLKTLYQGDIMVLQTEFATIKGNDLYIDDVKATDLIQQYGSPLYVMSEGHIRKQFNTLKTQMLDKYENTLPPYENENFHCISTN